MKYTPPQQHALDVLTRMGIDVRILDSADACGRWVCIAFAKDDGLVPVTDWGYSNLANVFKHIEGHYKHLRKEGDVFYVFRTRSQSTEWMRQVFDAAFGV